MLPTLVKNEKYRKLFFALSFMLSAVLTVNPVVRVQDHVKNSVENMSLL